MYIKLSTTDSLPASFTTTLFTCYTGDDTSTSPNVYTTTYKQFTVELTGISGTVWLAFDHEDTEGQSIYLDDVSFEEIVNNDILALTVDNPLAAARKNIGAAFQPKATFKNNGVLTQTNIPVRLKIISPLAAVVYNNAQSIASLAPGSSTQVSFSNFTPSSPGTYTARAIAQNSGDTNPSNDSTEVQFRIPDDISGIRTVGTGGDVATLDDAVRYLNENNVAGPLTFLLLNSMYTEPPLPIDPINYTTTPQPVVFKPSSGVNATVTIAATPASPYGVRLKGSAHVTFDGSNNNTTSRNLTLVMDTTGFFAPGMLLTYGYQDIAVKNLVMKGFSRSDGSANSGIVIDSSAGLKNDSAIVFDNLQIMRAFNGLFLQAPDGSSKVTILNCTFGGSGIDAIAQAGIVAYSIDSLRVIKNDVKDLVQTQGIIDLYGLYVGSGCTNPVVASNRFHAMSNRVNGYYVYGIANAAGVSSNLLCYNNFLYDMLSSGSGSGQNLTLALYSGNGANAGERYFYNSVSLNGHDSSTSPASFSAGLMLEDGVSALTVENNIVVSSMTFGSSSTFNRSYCVYDAGSSWPGGSASNHNDYYPSGAQGAVGLITGSNRISLGDWQAASSQDGNSISADPLFVAGDDLHLQSGGSSPADGQAIPIAGITTDIDGEVRDATTPDMGADESAASVEAALALIGGWNMVSIPVVPADPRKSTLFPGAASNAFAYQGSYVVKDTMRAGTGYWLKYASPQEVHITGIPVSADSVAVTAGWNLVGALAQPIPASSVLSIPPSIVTSQFFGYSGSYVTTDTLVPGKGFWVKVNQGGVLLLTAGGQAAARAGRIDIVPTSELPPGPPQESSEGGGDLPHSFALRQNYPNPFNPSTTIHYDLPYRSHVRLIVFNVLGQQVSSLVDGDQEAGYQFVVWGAGIMSSGLYVYRLEATPVEGQGRTYTEARKMLILK